MSTTTTTDKLSLTIARETFRAAMASIAPAVPSRTQLPILANVLIEATDAGTLRLTATDLDVTTSLTVEGADVAAAGTITVPAKRLAEIAATLPHAPVKIAAADNRVSVSCGKASFKVLTLPADEFPKLESGGPGDAWTVDAAAFHSLAQRVAFAASTEMSRPILNGVLLEREAGKLRMVATNGHRLAMGELVADGLEASSQDLIVPPAALERARKLMPAAGEGDTLTLSVSGNWLTITSDAAEITTRLIEGPYPNYRQVIPGESETVMTADRKELLAALKRVSLMASDATHRTKLVLDGVLDELRLSCQTPDEGESLDAIPAENNGKDFAIGFNAQYLIQVLGHITTDEVRFLFGGPTRAALVRPAGDDPTGYTALVMPLRLLEG